MGIYLGDLLFFHREWLPSSFLYSALFISFLLLLILYKRFSGYSSRWLFGFTIYLSLLVVGISGMNIHLQKTSFVYPSQESIYKVIISDQPQLKENSILCPVHVLQVIDSSSIASTFSQKALLYFSSDSLSKTLRRGDELLISAQLSMPVNRGNPDEFDYARYLVHKGISATGFEDSGKWQVVHSHSGYFLNDYALDCRDRILRLYRDLGFEGDAFAVLSALTVGYKEELSEDIRESYSVTGASHVLALSGLHIGFLYLLLLFLVKRIPGNSLWMDVLRMVFILVVLWGFAWIAGFSPSVIRSVIMFSLLGISRFFQGSAVSMNTLSVAAIGMLIFNPSLLFDVGFQLSFVAVAAILIIQPWLYRKLSFRNGVWDNIWQLCTVSIAAQIGTAPLVIFYFSRFSVHFLLTNILIIPLVTVIMYSAMAMLVLSFWPSISGLVAYGLNWLLELLNGIVRGVEGLPFASIDQIWIYRFEVLLIYLLLLFLSGYLMKRKAIYILACLFTVFAMTIYRTRMVDEDRPRQSLVFYNIRNCPAVHCISPDGTSWLAYGDSLPDEKRLLRTTSKYRSRLGLSRPIAVSTDHRSNEFIRLNNIVCFGARQVCIVNDNRWNNRKTEERFPIDYIYLCKGYTGRVEELMSAFSIRQVVFDSSVSDYRRRRWQEECVRLGIPFTNLSEGPLIIKV